MSQINMSTNVNPVRSETITMSGNVIKSESEIPNITQSESEALRKEIINLSILKEQFDNPIDEFLKRRLHPVAKWFINNGFNSSGVITLSLAIGILSFKLIGDKNLYGASITYLLSYLLDFVKEIMDKQIEPTETQKKYNLFKNLLIHGFIIYIILSDYSLFEGCSPKVIFLILIGLVILSMMNYGCNKITNNNITSDEPLLQKISIGLCPATDKNEAENISSYTKYFSVSTWVLLLSIMIANMDEFVLRQN